MPRDSRRPEAVREGVPLLPLRGVIVFPCMTVPLEVGRDRSVAAVEEAMIGNRLVMLASQKQARLNEPTPADIFSIGTLAEIRQMARYPDGTIRVLVEGLERARILEYTQAEPFYKVRVEDLRPFEPMTKELEALMRAALTYFESYVRLGKKVPAEILSSIQAVQDPGRLADDIAAHLPLRPEDKQSVLEAVSVTLRLERLCAILLKEIEILELERKINTRVRKQMERTQKEYYLREQMKAIQKELGERDERQSEAEEYLQKIKEKGLPDEAEEKAIREVERLEKMPPMAAEAVVVRTYIDWLLALPWSSRTEDRLDLPEAARILDEDHYGLEKVKERILEFLAVRRLTSRPKGPILCFVGPPGVGKTSLGKSIARALGREFVRFSLGGVRDEAEIRGHRRTYVGALPGRIIQAMRQASSKNPVILLDEVDKMSSDFRGDPASALLEVLDPEQNATFSDHYIAVHVEVVDTTDTIFKNKVVKEGVFQVDIIYASCDGLVHHVCREIPFMTSAHIKCVRPGMHVQNEVIDTEQKIEIVTTPRRGAKCQCFDVMVAATFLIRVTADVVKSPVQRHTVGRCCPHHKKTASSLRRKK
jgi:ATP-dependent Lon protease